MKIKKIIFFFFVLTVTSFNAQQFELGKVKKEELIESKHKIDSLAPASVIFKKGKSYFEYVKNSHFVLVTEVELKLKIYKKEGFDFANQIIPFYTGSNEPELVELVSGYTYNLTDKKIVKTKLTSEGIFNVKENKLWSSKKYIFPNVREGSIIELKYKITSKYFSNLKEWYFQSTIPVDYSEYTTFIPQFYSYNIFQRGTLNLNIEKDHRTKGLNVYDEDVTKRGGSIAQQATAVRVAYLENSTKIFVKNAPKLTEEPYSNSLDNYLSCVQYELTSIQYPEQKIENVAETWDDVAKNISKDEDFGKQIEKYTYYENDLKKIIEASYSNSKTTIHNVLEFLKRKVKWNGFDGIFVEKGVEKAYLDGIGNSTEINLMLISMLRKVGINASPVLVTTRDKAINLFPNLSAFNYVLCLVEIDNNSYYLDASNEFSYFNMVPLKCLNFNGIELKQNISATKVDLFSKFISGSNILIEAEIDNLGSIMANVQDYKSLMSAFQKRNEIKNLGESSYVQVLGEQFQAEISDFKIENFQNLEEPVIQKYKFKSENTIEKINDKLYFSPLLGLRLKSLFSLEERKYPLIFDFPFTEKITTNIKIPKNHRIEYLPKSVSYSFLEGEVIYDINYEVDENGIKVVSNFSINTNLISQDNYSDFKIFWNEVIKKQNENIVLKKI